MTFSGVLLSVSSVGLAIDTPPSFDLAFYAGTGAQEGNGVAVDASGNIYVTGQYNGNATIAGTTLTGYGTQDYFLASYDSTGAPRWGLGAGTSGSDFGSSVKLAPNGDVVVSGSMFMPATIHGTNFTGNGGRDAFVARYTSTGTFLWARVVSGTSDDQGDDVAVDGAGNVIISGRIRGSVTVGSDTFGTANTNTVCHFVAKFDPNGNSLWAKAASTQSDAFSMSGLAVDSDGNIYYAGQNIISGTPYIKVSKMTAQGADLWSTNHESISSFSTGSGVAVDPQGNVYVSGTYSSGAITIGSTTLENPNGALRGFIAKHDANGNVLWADRLGGRAYRIGVTPDGSAYTAGLFGTGSTNFSSTNLTVKAGPLDSYVAKHSSDGQLVWLHHVAHQWGYNEVLRSITVQESGIVHVTGEGTTAAFDLESEPQLGAVAIARISTNFIPKFNLTYTVSPSFSGFISTAPSTSDDRYPSNKVVEIRAYPGSNKAFAGWAGALTGTENPTSIIMDSDKTVTAIFTNVPVRYTLSTSVSPVDSGSIQVSPASTNGYEADALVQLTAVPASGQAFAGWSGAVEGAANPVSITMSANKSVTATFTNVSTPVYSFNRIVDATTPVPNGTGSFTNLGTPRIVGDSIYFFGKGTDRQGLYKWNNATVTRLVDTSMSTPAGTGTFSSIGEFNINDDGDVFFSANSTSGTNGIYRIRGDVIAFMVGNTTAVPNKEQTFRNVRSGFGIGDLFTFNGYSLYNTNVGTGLYSMTNGTISLLIDRDNGTLPGTAATFMHSDGGVMDDGQVAFWVSRSDGKAGIYCYSSNAFHLIADTNTVAPGQAVKFTGFSDPPRIKNGTVLFHGSFSGGAGLYSANADGSALTKIVDTSTLVPGSTNTFQSGFFVAYTELSNGRLLFYQGYWDEVAFKNKPRMYLYDNGTITMLVDGATLLDGDTPTTLGWGAQSIDASGDIAFMASFGASAPYTPAIYTTLDGGGTPTQFTLTKNVSPAGAGTVSASPASADGKYDANTVVELTAAPASGKVFVGWSGAASGTNNPVSVTMSEDKTVTALFTNAPVAVKNFRLTKSVSPAGSGIITADPSSANGNYPSNTLVTLTATPNSGFKFLRWSGASSSTNSSVNIRMNANKTVQALFTNLPKYKLTLVVVPPSAGSVTVSPFAPSNTFFAGTAVSLLAVPNGTNVFSAWIGAAPALDSSASLTMNGSKTVKALFNNPGKFFFQNTSGQVAQWFMQNTNRLGSVLLNNGVSAGSNWRLAASADLDNNGSKDLLFRGTNGQVSAWMMNGNIPEKAVLLRNGDTVEATWRLAAVGDLDQDDDADILWQNTSGTLNVWTMDGTSFSSEAALPYTAANGYKVLGIGNCDTNSSPDLLLQNGDGKVAVWFMNGSTRTGSKVLNRGASPGPGWIVAGATDVNNDTKTDIVFRRSDGSILVWFMNGSNLIRSQILADRVASPWVLRAIK